ncbi:N-methyl-L-tryptophan oxidase [bacterium]|nr:N-methyl-L-tryptophan oxidase [bacterium]
MKSEFEYIVAGLGGLGSAAAYWLSRRAGKDVLGLEQFPLGHPHGESQDHSRIIRLSYHTPFYVRLAKQAYQAWASLEQECCRKLIVKTGGLDLWPPNSAIPMRDYTQSLLKENVDFEILNAAETMSRFPQFRLQEDIVGLYQAEGGIAPAALCNAEHQRLAQEHGATLLENTPIISISCVSEGYIVQTKQQTYTCRKLVVAGGPWSNRLLAHFGIELPLTVTQEQVNYFVSQKLDSFQPDRFPIWIWMDDPCFYGFPMYGENAVKVGQDVGGKEVSTETRTYDADPEALKQVENFLQKALPDALGPVLYTKSCLYTLTPDRDFVIDAIPGHPDCLIAIGAGHAFKFASLIGKILSEMAIDGHAESDVSQFKITRPILQEKNPTKNFMT